MSEKYEINLASEEILALSSDLPKYVHELVGGKRIHKSTAYRWALRGVRGRRLPTVRVAGRLYTSKAAFAWWAAKLAEDLVGMESALVDTAIEPRQVGEIEDVLRRAGIKD